jgi:hypothetical protein
MGIPTTLMNSVCVLGGYDRDRFVCGATAFFVSVPPENKDSGRSHVYLVTAKHAVENAKGQFGRVYIRINTRDGIKHVPVETLWE